MPTDLREFPTDAILAQEVGHAAGRLLTQLSATRSPADPVELAIAGGFVATRVLPSLAETTPDLDWSRIRVWWVDERFVPADDPQRNDREALEALFSHTPGVTLERMPDDRGQSLDQAVGAFGARWNAVMAGRSIDFAILGVGPDGHFASLFPGHPQLDRTDDVLAVENSPKLPPRRLTLSRPVITGARRIWVAAAGSGKADALARALTPGTDYHEVPAAALRGQRTAWWLDAAAAQRIERS